MKSLRARYRRATSGDSGYALVTIATLVMAGVSRVLGAHPHPEMLSDTTITSRMHLLSADLLRHHLWQSIINLHSAPPLFNLQTAALLHLPFRNTLSWALGVICAAVTAIATYGLIRFFGVSQRIAIVVVVIYICCDPARIIFANYYSYDEATAALVTVIAWSACVSIRQRTTRSLRILWWSVALLTLYNSNYSIYVLLLALSPGLWLWRSEWRKVCRSSAVPLLCVAIWYANDFIRFHQATTSSWVGMNLARNTVMLSSSDDLRQLVHDKVLGPVVLIRPFDYPKAYKGLVSVPATGVEARDRKMDLYGVFPAANFNWDGYRAISSLYVENDIAWIAHRPAAYAHNVARTQFFWNLPLSQFYLVEETPGATLSGYTAWYAKLVEWQPQVTENAAGSLVLFHVYPRLTNISWLAVIETVISLAVFPILLFRRIKRNMNDLVGLVPWLLLTTTFIGTSLVEVSENNRFRFETGGVPLALTAITAMWLVQTLRRRQTPHVVEAAPSSGA
jgi:hypothetical protein